MNALFYLTLFSCLCALSFSKTTTTYYIDQSSTANPPNGSRDKPFPSLEQAISILGEGNFELILLGNELTLESSIVLVNGSTYKIRPETIPPGKTHFPLIYDIGVDISGTLVDFSMEDIQLVETDQNRNPITSPIYITQGNLTLNRIKATDIIYDSVNTYSIYTIDTGTLTMTNCEFRNDTNLQIWVLTSQLIVINCTLSIINQDLATLFSIYQSIGPNDIIFQNMTLEDSNFYEPKTSPGSFLGFINFLDCNTNITFDGFTLKNLTITNGNTLVSVTSGGGLTQLTPANFTIINFGMENIFENLNSQSQSESKALIFDISQAMNYTINGFSIKTFRIQYSQMAFITQDENMFAGSIAILENFIIENSTNANFWVKTIDTVTIQNVLLKDNTFNTTDSSYPLFFVWEADKLLAQNLYADNQCGPVYRLQSVLNQQFYNHTFLNAKSSQLLPTESQTLVGVQRLQTDVGGYLNTEEELVTIFKNFNIYGFSDVDDLNSSSESNNTYALIVKSQVGNVYIEDSVWSNFEFGGLLSVQMSYLKVDNLTVDADPSINPVELVYHRMFQFVNVAELVFVNSQFYNNQNFFIFNLWNIDRGALFQEITLAKFTFENLTVINNTANNPDPDNAFTSIISINSPLTAVEMTFRNCYFKNNSITTGIVLMEESYQINATYINNTFESNYGLDIGTAINVQSMQSAFSSLQIANNIFKNNTCQKDGGVFGFTSSNYIVNATNNTYLGNSAGDSGGVGYVYESRLVYLETDGVYTDNSAGDYGGAWLFSLTHHEGTSEAVKFSNTSFNNSEAAKSGGAIYFSNGDLIVEDVSFQNSAALVSGGDVYLYAFSSLNVTGGKFIDSQAPEGSLVFAETLLEGEKVNIQNTRISNKITSYTDSSLIQANSGSLQISNTLFSPVYSPILQVEGTSIIFDNVTFSEIDCYSLVTSCLVNILSGTFTFLNSQITGVTSYTDLISLTSPVGSLLIDNIQISNIQQPVHPNAEVLSVFNVDSAGSITIQNSNLTQVFGFISMKFLSSNFQIIKTNFVNNLPTQRSLQEGSITNNYEFLWLQSSYGTVVGVTFQTTGQSNNSNGAIQIRGSKGNYVIDTCNFEGNQGGNGGAINIATNAADYFTIQDTQFINNQGRQNGGAVYFANSSVINPINITRSTFSGNAALYGGGIYIGNQQAFIGDSNFDGNSADEGGAITSFGNSTTKLVLDNDTFVNNTASIGSALRTIGLMNIVEEGTIVFVGNVATLGGDIATQPTQLVLKIFEVDEAFLFIDTISHEFLLTDSQTILIYDSTNPALNGPLEQTIGRTPNYLYEFTFLDDLNQSLPVVENATVSLTAIDTGNRTGIVGSTIYSINGTSGLVFGSFFVLGNVGNTITFSAQMMFYNQFLNQYENLPRITWEETLVNCSVGELYDSVNNLCNPCPAGTYTYEDPSTASSCTACPDTLVCLGGSINFPVPGYWRISANSNNIVQCFNDEACLGGEILINGEPEISAIGFCAPGYEGVNCGVCMEGYAKFGSTTKSIIVNNNGVLAGQTCVNCSTKADYYIRFVIYFLIQIAVIVITTIACLAKPGMNDEELKEAIIKATIIKIIIDFVQILNIISEFSFGWPSVVGNFLATLTKINPSNGDALSTDCFIALITGSNTNVFYIKLLLLVLQPLVFIFLGLIVWIIVFRLSKRSMLDSSEFKTRIIITTVVIVYIMQPGIVRATFQLFNCRNFGPTYDPQYYLVPDTAIECWTADHTPWALGLGIPALIIWFVIPTVILIYLMCRKSIVQSKRFKERYGFIFEKYRKGAYYWEILILAIKVILIILAVFVTFDFLQAYISFVALLIAYALHHRTKPLITSHLNTAEGLSLFSLTFIVYTGLFFVRTDESHSLVPFLLALDTFTSVAFLLYCLYVAFLLVRKKFSVLRERLYKKLDLDARKPTKMNSFLKKVLGSPKKEPLELPMIPGQPQESETEIRESDSDKPPKNDDTVQNQKPLMNIKLKKATSLDDLDDSGHHIDLHFRSQLTRRSSDDFTPRINSIRGTDVDLLHSFQGDKSFLKKSAFSRNITNQTFDTEEDKLFKLGSIVDVGSRNDLGLDVVEEEPPTATLQKEMFKDDRFKDLDKVEFKVDENEEEGDQNSQHENGSIEEDEILTLSAVLGREQDKELKSDQISDKEDEQGEK